jgi:glycosyltransferase involved in cell wall biosynthesis
MWTLARLWRSRRVHSILTAPIRLSRRLLKSASAGLAALSSLTGRAVDQAMMAADNCRRRLRPPGELVVFDDSFPHLLSAFRIAEFNSYLAEFPSAEVHSTCSTCHMEGATCRQVATEYAIRFPQFATRVVRYDPRRRVRARMAYFVFANNAKLFQDTITRNRLPFVFTLYPGGGFQLNSPETDAILSAAMRSPWFRKVIATQRVTRDYLIDRHFCRPEQVAFIYGGVLPSDQLARSLPPRLRYGKTKATFDVCFAANKYTPRGIDKGYDVFVEVARALSGAAGDIRFHVVGPFDGRDIDVSEIADRIKFHGFMRTDSFPEFYAGMDAILSPNVPFVLGPGYFDGFPTGCCIEAALCGVIPFCADELKLNVAFTDGEDIVIVPRDVEAICGRLLDYYRDEAAREEMSRKTQAAFHRVFDVATQMTPRIRILREVMTAS